jgi:hypothetical protein
MEIFASQDATSVSTISVANLPQISTIPAANFAPVTLVAIGREFAAGVNDTGGNQQHQR